MPNYDFSPLVNENIQFRESFVPKDFRAWQIFRHMFAPKKKKKYSRKIKSTKVYRYTFRGGPGNCRTLGKWTNINIRKGKPPHVEKLTPFYFIFW